MKAIAEIDRHAFPHTTVVTLFRRAPDRSRTPQPPVAMIAEMGRGANSGREGGPGKPPLGMPPDESRTVARLPDPRPRQRLSAFPTLLLHPVR